MSVTSLLLEIQDELREGVDKFEAPEPVVMTYNPLDYASRSATEYLKRYGALEGSRPAGDEVRRVLLLGMNPGPWGMAQTGVPFGDKTFVSEWMGICDVVDKPPVEHPKRPIDGFDCSRSEVSGSRLWGWARDYFGTPENFFSKFFVWNYCPLSFMLESGANFTPNKFPKEVREELFEPCDKALRGLVETLNFTHLIGVGGFAEKRLQKVFNAKKKDSPYVIGRVLHPSPASPVANRGWAEAAEKELREQGALPE